MSGYVDDYLRTQRAVAQVESELRYSQASYERQTEIDRALYHRAAHLERQTGLRPEQAILQAGSELKESGYEKESDLPDWEEKEHTIRIRPW